LTTIVSEIIIATYVVFIVT